MPGTYSLFVDESGEFTPSRHRKSPLFIVAGCIVNPIKIGAISNHLDNIKFKFFRNTSVVFRSTDIDKKRNEFKIFRNERAKYKNFLEDLKNFMQIYCHVSLIGIVVDQQKAFYNNWKKQTVIKRAYSSLIENYIRLLCAKNNTGNIIQEASSTFQDIKIYEQFFYYQTTGIPPEKITHKEVKKRLTSLSFATKHNMDTLMQIADLLACGIRYVYLVSSRRKKVSSLNSYQKLIRSQAKNKLFSLPDEKKMTAKKRTIYKRFEALKGLP